MSASTNTATPQYQMVFKRTEEKYLVSDAQRARLEALLDRYMVPDAFGASTIRNVYLDTPSFELVRLSEEHPYYKEKVRIRSYQPAWDETPVYLEIKKKCDGVVYKRRAELAQRDARALVSGRRAPQTQIEREIAATSERLGWLVPAAYVAYDRVAYYDPACRDFRMTLDRRVRVRWDKLTLSSDEATPILKDGLSILEVKTSQAMPMWLVDYLTRERIFKASFSKYGTAFRLRFPEGFRGAASPVGLPVPKPTGHPAHQRELVPAHIRRAPAHALR